MKVLAAAKLATKDLSPPLTSTAHVPVATSGFFWKDMRTPSALAQFSRVSPKLSVPIAPKYAVLFGTYYSMK